MAAALLCSVAPADAAFPGNNGKIAFEGITSTGLDLFTANTDGTGITRLTSSPGDERVPRWSPDGKKLAFTADFDGHGIYVMDWDGGKVVKVTASSTDFAPAWSPDGTKIAFRSSSRGLPTQVDDEIYVVDVASREVAQLTDNSAGDFDPAWSPDGSQIAFWSRRSVAAEIWVMNSDGSNATQLTESPLEGDSPEWSPASNLIAFHYSGNLYVMGRDGSDVRAIGRGGLPAWSPDGSRILFVSTAQNRDLYTMNADGTDVRFLLDNTTFDYNPDWQPIPEPRRADYRNAAQFCKALREFLGDEDFRARYGGGANAYGKCVNSNTH